jgi:hypothetical protein
VLPTPVTRTRSTKTHASQEGRWRCGARTVSRGAARGVGHTDPVTKNKGPIPELRDIPVNDGDVVIGYDSDVSRNRAVREGHDGPGRLPDRQRRTGEYRWPPADVDGKDRSWFWPSPQGPRHGGIASATARKTLALGKGFCPSRTRKR